MLKATVSTDTEEFPDSYDYANLSLSEFNEVVIQKLILVSKLTSLLPCYNF